MAQSHVMAAIFGVYQPQGLSPALCSTLRAHGQLRFVSPRDSAGEGQGQAAALVHSYHCPDSTGALRQSCMLAAMSGLLLAGRPAICFRENLLDQKPAHCIQCCSIPADTHHDLAQSCADVRGKQENKSLPECMLKIHSSV